MGEVQLKIDSLADAKRQIDVACSLIEELSNDTSNVELFCEVGDRFNGLIGTFSFGEGQEIFEELVDVSRMIDNVIAIYKKDDIAAIRLEHLSFIGQAALFLKKLMECYVSQGNIEEIRPEKKAIIEVYISLGEVEEREVLDQDSIDDLLDDLL